MRVKPGSSQPKIGSTAHAQHADQNSSISSITLAPISDTSEVMAVGKCISKKSTNSRDKATRAEIAEMGFARGTRLPDNHRHHQLAVNAGEGASRRLRRSAPTDHINSTNAAYESACQGLPAITAFTPKLPNGGRIKNRIFFQRHNGKGNQQFFTVLHPELL